MSNQNRILVFGLHLYLRKMNAAKYFLIFPILIFGCQSKPETNSAGANEPKWVNLFNQENLEGWTPKVFGQPVGENYGNTFQVDSGILKIRYDAYGDFNNQFGALYTKRSYKNYRIRAEYRFVGDTATGAPPWGFRDSGIMFHAQSPESLLEDQPFPICLEYNLHGGDGLSERPNGQVCLPGTIVEIGGARSTQFCNNPELAYTFHGDQWVTLEIDVMDTTISHFINGEKILTYYNPRYDMENEVATSLIVDGNDRVNSGHIAIQSNSAPIDFKRIEIMEYGN